MQDELVSQMFSGPLQLVLVSTAGVLQLERRRPVDVLQALLQVRACAAAAAPEETHPGVSCLNRITILLKGLLLAYIVDRKR
jgi:hypothetical protein